MKKGSFYALLPLVVFVILYFSISLYFNDFYKIPTLVLFMLSLFLGFLQFPKVTMNEKMAAFAKGAGNENILIMILIFLLAGGFGKLSNEIGSIESTINFALSYIHPQWIIAGLFVVSCFISTSLGTSVGTIAAVAPIAVGLENSIEGSMALGLAAVIGGAMFGDNLSFISDTTIAATRTQGVRMKDKFLVNFKIVAPVAVLTCLIYGYMGNSLYGSIPQLVIGEYCIVKMLPYMVVLVLALLGLNVIWTLLIGIIMALAIGVLGGSIFAFDAFGAINSGFFGMFELSILCLIIGGVVGLIRYNGGIDYLLRHLGRRAESPKKAELSIALLTGIVNICIANNTITIVIVGPLAKEIAGKNNVSPKRVASIMDTVSCFVQGILPYGAQLLAALAAAAYVVSPIEIIQYLYYPFLIGVSTLAFIVFAKSRPIKESQTV